MGFLMVAMKNMGNHRLCCLFVCEQTQNCKVDKQCRSVQQQTPGTVDVYFYFG